MSRHRASGPMLAEPCIETTAAPPGDMLAELFGTTDLERLRGMVLAFPRTAHRLLNERQAPDTVVRYTLRAEAALRLDRPREAMALASTAVNHAMREEPVDPGRLLPAVTVLADAAVVAGAPDAVRSCMDLAGLASKVGDQHRLIVAAGLHAVAVFQQHSCREARHLLDQIGHTCTDGGIVAAISLACDTVTACCAHRGQPHWPPPTLPVITAGGLVQAALTAPFLPDRLLRWPGVHDCSSTSG